MRAVGQESKYYDRVAEGASAVSRTGPLRTFPCHPLCSREWCAGGAGCSVIVKSSDLSTKGTKDMLEYQREAPRAVLEYVT